MIYPDLAQGTYMFPYMAIGRFVVPFGPGNCPQTTYDGHRYTQEWLYWKMHWSPFTYPHHNDNRIDPRIPA